jgi:hypothetical protein
MARRKPVRTTKSTEKKMTRGAPEGHRPEQDRQIDSALAHVALSMMSPRPLETSLDPSLRMIQANPTLTTLSARNQTRQMLGRSPSADWQARESSLQKKNLKIDTSLARKTTKRKFLRVLTLLHIEIS